jgi:tetratricopeptide (TPR) repeat protein
MLTISLRHLARLALFTTIWLCAAYGASAQNAVVRGIVRDVLGEPIRGVLVTTDSIERGRSEEFETNSAGRFTFIGLQAGRWRFVVTKRGYESVQGFMMVGRTGDQGVIEFEMEFDPLHPPAPTTGRLAGKRADDIQAGLDEAHEFFDRGDYDGAIAAYETVLEQIPSLTSLHLQIGHAYREKQEYDRARDAYRAVPAASRARAEAESAIEELAILAQSR